MTTWAAHFRMTALIERQSYTGSIPIQTGKEVLGYTGQLSILERDCFLSMMTMKNILHPNWAMARWILPWIWRDLDSQLDPMIRDPDQIHQFHRISIGYPAGSRSR